MRDIHMANVTRFPETANSQKAGQQAFEAEVKARFGLLPNFFRSAPDAPAVVRELWQFAQAAYLDTPIPSLFKERLFVYLSRFCEARYCVTRHCGFLLGLGRAAGDAGTEAMTVPQVIRLLGRQVPDEETIDAALARLEAVAQPIDWPSAETSNDDDLFTSATILFLRPARAERAKLALQHALGGEKFEQLIGFMTFIRSAHYWTLMHPEIRLEDDVKDLLLHHEELARLLAEVALDSSSETGTRMSEELQRLRDVNERRELEKARDALELKDRQRDLILKEVDHRIKNSLQIVSSLLHLQARTAGGAAPQFHSAASRIGAIAAVHRQLHKSDYIGTVELGQHLIELCAQIATASGSPDRPWSVSVDSVPLTIPNDIAVPLSLIVNELLSNSIQHAKPAGERVLRVVVRSDAHHFSVGVSDPGNGPGPAPIISGLGTRLVESLAGQINATLTRESSDGRYTVTISVPHVGASLDEAGSARKAD
jgi:two-component sensor histidine kinase